MMTDSEHDDAMRESPVSVAHVDVIARLSARFYAPGTLSGARASAGDPSYPTT